MDEKKKVEDVKPVAEPTVKASEIQGIVTAAVAAAMASRIHQHTPIGQVIQTELSGRSREEGNLIVTTLDDNPKWTEYQFNDGTVRRDYK